MLSIAAGPPPGWRRGGRWRGTREAPACGMLCQNAIIYFKCCKKKKIDESLHSKCVCLFVFRRGKLHVPAKRQWSSSTVSLKGWSEVSLFRTFRLSSCDMCLTLLPIKAQDDVVWDHNFTLVSSTDYIFNTLPYLCRVNTGPALPHPWAEDHRPVL